MNTKTLISVAGLYCALFFGAQATLAQDKPATKLRDVTITGTRPLIKQDIDRLSYDLQADPESKGNSVLEMMRKVPMLSLDANDNIQLKGESNFKILINGKPSSLMERNAKEVLRSMPASTIQRIEVITNPPSKYDAEGLTGIINIITYKNVMDGFRASVNVYQTMPVGGPGTGASFSSKSGKFGFHTFAGAGIYNSPETTATLERNALNGSGADLLQEELNEKDSKSAYWGTELSYEIDSLKLLSVEFNLNRSLSNSRNSRRSLLNENGGLQQAYSLLDNKKGNGDGQDFSINYQLGFKNAKSKLLTISYRFYGYDFEDSNDLDIANRFNYNLPNYQQKSLGSATENTFQTDFVQTVNKLNIEAGAKAIIRLNASDYSLQAYNDLSDQYITDPSKSNIFNNKQQVYALYNTYKLNIAEWVFKLGFRLEKTVTDADFTSTDTKIRQQQLNLIPALLISKTLQNNQTLNLGYTQRIQRPGIYQLNPFIDRSNPDVQMSGNPSLRPVIADAIQLTYHIQGKASINVNLDYTAFNALINQVADYNSELNFTTITYQNTGKAKMLSTNLSVNYPVSPAISVSLNTKLAYGRVEGISNRIPIHTEGIMYSLSISPAYKIASGWRANGNLNIRSSSFSLQRINNAYTSTSLGLSKELIKNKLTFSTAINNPFNKYRNNITELTGTGFEQYRTEQTYYRSYRLSLNYNFGQLKDAVKKNKRGIKNDDSAN